MRVYRSRETYEATAKFTTWLFRIATHLALNWLRDEKNERAQERLDQSTEDAPTREVPDRAPSVEQQMVHAVKVEEVRRAVAALPDKQRAAVLMHKYRRDGIFADCEGVELLGIGGKIAFVPGL